jgi:hypothetical protein
MLKKIQKCFRADRVYYSRHARDEMEGEESGEIKDEEVFEAVSTGRIIKIIQRMNLIQVVSFMAERLKIDRYMSFVVMQMMKIYPLL